MAENLSNNFSTTLNGAINDVTTSLVVTSATGSPAANFRIRIDDEIMLVTSKGSGTDWTVTRGVEGTTPASHANLAPVTHILTLDGLINWFQDRTWTMAASAGSFQLATNDVWLSARGIANQTTNPTWDDGMYIGYGNTSSGRTRIYGEGSTAAHVYPDVNGNLLRSDGSTYWHSGNDGAGSGLDADLLDGMNSAEAATASTIAARNSSGYLFAVYLNQSSGDDENPVWHTGVPSNTQFFITNGTDGYLRKAEANYVERYLPRSAGSNSTERGPFNWMAHTIRGMGLPLYVDDEFTYGTNSINLYNNNGGSALVISRDTDGNFGIGTAPNSSGILLRGRYLTGTPPGTSPGFGGFQQQIDAEDNHTFVQVFKALLPSGRAFEIAENSQGTNNTSYWLTPKEGTGKWEWYARVSHCGDSGSFSSGGHVYVSGGADANFDWYLAYANVFDVTEAHLFRRLRAELGGTMVSSGNAPLKITTANSGPWQITLERQDLGDSSSVFFHSGGWYFEDPIKVNGDLVWNAGNDGAGSGLDADLLDARSSLGFVLAMDATSNLNTIPTDTRATYETYTITATNKPVSQDNANGVLTLVSHPTGGSGTYGKQIAFANTEDLYMRQFSNGSFSSWRKFWHDGNDGAGSGLDADLLDGLNSAATATVSTIVARDANGAILAKEGASGGFRFPNDAFGGSGDTAYIKLTATSGESQKLEIGVTNDNDDVINISTPSSTGFKHNDNTVWDAGNLSGTMTIDTFSGTGAQTAFTLSIDPGSENNTFVFIDGVYQQKSEYSVSGTTLTFTEAPPSGTSNIQVATGVTVPIGTPGDGTVTTAKIADANVTEAKLSFKPFRKNALINGAMEIWQRGTGPFVPSGTGYIADRWYYEASGSHSVEVSRSTDVPTFAQAGRLFTASHLLDVTSAEAAVAAAEYAFIAQKIEGFNFAHFAQRDCVLSFWVKSTKTGTFCVHFRNQVGDRSFVREYTINATNTWEKKTVTMPASPSAGTWDYNNDVGLHVGFALMAGSNWQGAADTWNSADDLATANQVNALDSTSNNFLLTGVQFELGTTATEFDYRPYDEELLHCMRYWELGGNAGHNIFSGNVTSGNNYYIGTEFRVPKRTTPSMNYSIVGFSNFPNSNPSTNSSDPHGFFVTHTANGTGVGYYHFNWRADAEL